MVDDFFVALLQNVVWREKNFEIKFENLTNIALKCVHIQWWNCTNERVAREENIKREKFLTRDCCSIQFFSF